MSEIITFNIFDQDYSLKVSNGQGRERLTLVAEIVDHKMKEVASRYVGMSAKEIAVLAALNLADDYLELQTKLSEAPTGVGVAESEIMAYTQRINTYLEGESG